MRPALVVCTLAVLISCSGQADTGAPALQGVWKSNAERTLESMRSTSGISASAKRLFENDMFGHLHVEYRGDEARAWNEKDGFEMPFRKYEVIETNDRSITTRQWDETVDDYTETTVFLDGECFYMLVSRFKFREYFCKVA